MNERHDDLQEIIDAALREMAAEEGDGFDPQACNLAEFCRRTGLTRSRARTVRAHGFRALPHGNSARRAAPGVLAGHTGLVDDLLRKGVTNSQVIFERLLGQGYAGGLTTVKTSRAVPVPAPEDLLRRLRELRGAPLRRALLVRPPRVQGEPGGARGAHIQRRPLPRARRPRRRHRRRQLVRGAVGDIAGAARGAADPAGGDRGRANRPAQDETRFREVRLREGRMMAGAGASPYELASDAASRLGIAVGAEELATLASDLDLGDGEMAAVAATFSYLAEKRRLASIETLLRLSRLPRREPKTFEGFDFSRIQGRDAAALGKLPSLADLYAHRNVAFVGPGGIGKTHLAQAYGRECCMRGLKTYYIKATELRDRFQKAVQRGNTSRVVSSLVKPSCLIVDEVGRCVYDRPCTDLFFDVVDRRYEKEGPNAMVITSNIAPSGWDEFFTGDDTLL